MWPSFLPSFTHFSIFCIPKPHHAIPPSTTERPKLPSPNKQTQKKEDLAKAERTKENVCGTEEKNTKKVNIIGKGGGKEKVVVEVVGARNLMPKDGKGSSSPFVEVEFENQHLRTQVKHKTLNPVWNEKLVFDVSDPADLRYRTIDVNVFSERRSGNSPNFLGKVRVSGASVAARVGDDGGGGCAQMLYALHKKSVFSHDVRGDIALRMYLSSSATMREETKQMSSSSSSTTAAGGGKKHDKKKVQLPTAAGGGKKHDKKKVQLPTASMSSVQQRRQMQELQVGGHFHPQQMQNRQRNRKKQQVEQPGGGGGEITKPVVLATNPPISTGPGGGMLASAAPGGVVSGHPKHHPQHHTHEFPLKETTPHHRGGPRTKDKTSSTDDLVEQMQYLYVRVVKSRHLDHRNRPFSPTDLLAEVKLGNFRGITKRGKPEWNQVFAFSKDCIQSSVAEILVKEKKTSNANDFIGRVLFDLTDVPHRVPSDSQLASQWYRMEDKKGDKSKAGEVMVSIWFGTQADEAFADAFHSKAANVHLDGLSSIKSKVYLSPKMWYLRVTVIEAQDVVLGGGGGGGEGYPELFVKVQVGNQLLRTSISPASSGRSLSNPYWNEELLFVVAEPFEDHVLVSVEDRVGPGREEVVVGRVMLPVSAVERRWDDKAVASRWLNLDNHHHNNNASGMLNKNKNNSSPRFASRIHIRTSLDGGYHVLDEATMYSSDLRPTARLLWKPPIGILEMGILGATGLMPMKLVKDEDDNNKGTTDAYCVAKYGSKWVRTRTVIDSLSPSWNERYTWEVHDPCTVITVGLFDNSRLYHSSSPASTPGGDARIGKVRIRLSTLEAGRVYTHSYPLLMLHPSAGADACGGVKKMGELHLAVRFSCDSLTNTLHLYSQPLLPKMHYTSPLSDANLDVLRHQAASVVASRLARAEPPLGREVVEYILDHDDSHPWSMRRSRANYFRLMSVLSTLISLLGFLDLVRSWSRPVSSATFVFTFLFFVLFPKLILLTLLLYAAVVGMWRYRSRPRNPPHMDTHLSHVDSVHADEIDEEFDTFPSSSASAEVVRMRYDRMRRVARRIDSIVGDMATQGERFQGLLSWRDPRATFLFVLFCLVAAVGLYAVPIRGVVAVSGLYALRPPKFRGRLPSVALSFFRRLPSKADALL